MSLGDLIIEALIEEPRAIISGEEIAKSLGVSRTSIWKKIKSLKREGYEIEELKGKGYRLLSLSNRPLEREIKRGLTTRRFGKMVYHHERIGSTNDYAKRLARKGEREGAVIIAEEQSKGRGRLERKWISPRGGLYLSLIVRPNLQSHALIGVTLLAGLAVVKAIESLYKIPGVGLKWPNDLYVGEKKIGGILSEMEGEADRVHYIVIGVGINANSSVQADIPTSSLKKEIGEEINIAELAKKILIELESLYEEFEKGSTDFLKDYREYSHTIGKDVRIELPGRNIEGKAVNVNDEGALVLKLPGGSIEKIYFGDCIHLR